MPRHTAVVGFGRFDVGEAKPGIQRNMFILAHQVNRRLALLAHAFDEFPQQTLGQAQPLIIRVHHHRHDYHVRTGRVVADQFLERLVGHLHVKRRAGVDEAGHLPVHLGDDETVRPGGDARGDFLAGRGFVALIGEGFDGVAAIQVGGGDVADDGVHGGSKSVKTGPPRIKE